MKTNIIFIAVLILAALSFQSSYAQTIECSVERINKTFSIDNNSITLQQNEQGRTLASISSIRTKIVRNGFTKIINFEGHKYSLHIANTKQFNEVEDYIIIRSKKGHEITYPLSCM